MSSHVIALLGVATFVVSLGSGIAADAGWHDVVRPGVILPALGQVGGMILTYFGARQMDPK